MQLEYKLFMKDNQSKLFALRDSFIHKSNFLIIFIIFYTRFEVLDLQSQSITN